MALDQFERNSQMFNTEGIQQSCQSLLVSEKLGGRTGDGSEKCR